MDVLCKHCGLPIQHAGLSLWQSSDKWFYCVLDPENTGKTYLKDYPREHGTPKQPLKGVHQPEDWMITRFRELKKIREEKDNAID